MYLRSVDRDGRLLSFESILDAEGSLEWLDVTGGEYVIIDDEAFLYAWLPSDEGYYGYRLVRTATSHLEALSVLEQCEDENRVRPDLLEVVRRLGPATKHSTKHGHASDADPPRR